MFRVAIVAALGKPPFHTPALLPLHLASTIEEKRKTLHSLCVFKYTVPVVPESLIVFDSSVSFLILITLFISHVCDNFLPIEFV